LNREVRALCPDPAAALPAVYLKARIRHPLIYRKRIDRVDRSVKPGDWVVVYAPRQESAIDEESTGALPTNSEPELWGYGLYNPRSEIALRMIRLGGALPDESFWNERLRRAVELRNELLRIPEASDAYRLINAEGDEFPGLVVDRFGDALSAELFSWAMWQRAPELLRRLGELCGTRHTVLRTGPKMLSQEGFDEPPRISEGSPRSVVIQEHGTKFRVDLTEASHKTGFFCDQRDNRARLATFCGGKSVLDLCCYSGGFAVQAKCLGRAAEVIGVDLDEQPLRTAKENANLNRTAIRFVQADIFPYMRDMLRQGRRFDIVVLDPPKLINSRAEIDEGARTHFDMNRLAMQLVKSGGLLLTCSCAGLLPEPEFMRLVFLAARQAGNPIDEGGVRRGPRPARLLFRSGAAPDHPVASNCPEGEYLKAAWLTLDDPL
jgi:23S rRNA (cytosine1962-C5)-methyltransferase